MAAGFEPTLLQGTIGEINCRAVAEGITTPIEEMAGRWNGAQRLLASTANGFAGETLRLQLRVRSKQWVLPDLLRIAARHIRKHEKAQWELVQGTGRWMQVPERRRVTVHHKT